MATLLLVVLATLATLSARGAARPDYVQRLPNGGAVPGAPALGHVDPQGGGARNAFGEAFAAAGRRWTLALCLADSDGDGQRNGEELGDPCCVWQGGKYDSPTFAQGVAHPGDANSTVDPAILYQWVCGYHNVSGSVSGELGANPAPSGDNVDVGDATPTTTTPTTTTAAPNANTNNNSNAARRSALSGSPSPPVILGAAVVALWLGLEEAGHGAR